jgi:hypothetical protein
VSSAVNRTANDGPHLIVPLAEPDPEPPATPAAVAKRVRKPKPDKRQASLFD